MALIKCIECKRKISDSVDICPRCGKKITIDDKVKGYTLFKEETNKKRTTFICIILILILIFVCSLDVKVRSYQEKKYCQTKKPSVEQQKKAFYKNVDKFLSICNTIINDLGIKVMELDTVWANSILKVSDSETDKYTKDCTGKFIKVSMAVQKYIDDNVNDFDFIQKDIDHCGEYVNKMERIKYSSELTDIIIDYSKKLKKSIQAYYNLFYTIDYTYNHFGEESFKHIEDASHWINSIQILYNDQLNKAE